jgi:hypothetical protein
LEIDMNGALMKASSRFAIAAALGLGLGAGSARAADLGGNCCADLEERIAELEATTARKGNRKMSLTITGQVNRSVLWWDDTHMSRAYYGLDNSNSSTRFGLLGSAKVNPSVTMGFEILMDQSTGTGGTTFVANQLDEDGKRGTGAAMGNSVSFNNANSGSDTLFFTRRAAGWIEHKDVGRLTVGRYESAGVVATIDLGGILQVASSSLSLINGNFFVRGPQGQFYSVTWGTGGLGDPAANQGRVELVRYTSPTWQGFVFDSSIGERGDYWGSMLRYANEFNGVRVAAGFGYERIRDANTGVTLDPASPLFVGPQPDIDAWGGALSVMHVPTGLFVQGHYMGAEYSINAGNAATYWGAQNAHRDFTFWLLQAGIAKNWFGIGNTALYAEVAKVDNAAANDFPGRNFAGSSTFGAPFTGTATQNFTTVNGVTDTELSVWGLGIAQNVDAAASTLYLGYRNFSTDITCTGATTAAGQCAGAAGGTAKKLNTDDLHVVLGGMIVRF